MNTTANIEGDLIEPTMRALRQLSPASQGAVAALVRQLAETEGISVELTGAPDALRSFGKRSQMRPLDRISSSFTRLLLGSYGHEARF